MQTDRDVFLHALDELIASNDPLFIERLAKRRRASGPDYEARFKEIVKFQDVHGRPPERQYLTAASSPEEAGLVASLERLRVDPIRCEQLRSLDKYGVLLACPIDSEPAAPTSLDELIASGDPLLDTPDDDIFVHRHVTPAAERSDPDWIAERRPCKDFERFRPIFEECVAEINNGVRDTVKTNATQRIAVGDFFILNGQLAYIAEIRKPDRGGDPNNPRLRVIYDNGTESDHLLLSFGKALYRDDAGRRIGPRDPGALFHGVEMPLTGRVYLAKTLSLDPALASLKDHMVKIGSTKGAVEDRIRTAETDPTFLLAKATIVAEFETRGVPAHKFEGLLHKFFHGACLSLRIPDRFGNGVDPREWFVLRPATVARAVQLIAARQLHLYRYMVDADEILPK